MYSPPVLARWRVHRTSCKKSEIPRLNFTPPPELYDVHFLHGTWCTREYTMNTSGHFLRKSPIHSGSFAKNDVQLKASYGSWPPCVPAMYTVSKMRHMYVGCKMCTWYKMYDVLLYSRVHDVGCRMCTWYILYHVHMLHPSVHGVLASTRRRM